MKDYEAIAKCMQQYRLAKIALDADGNVRTMIAMPPEPEPVKAEDMSPEAVRKEAEALMFAHVEGPPIFDGKG